MYILQNALHNLARNKGRNMMIGVIIFVVIVSAVTALMINNTARGVIDDYKSRFGSEVTITPNMEKMREEAEANSTDGRIALTRPDLDAEEMIAYGDSEYLQKAVFTAESKGNSEDLTPIDEDKGGGGGMMFSRGGGPGGGQETESIGRQYYHKLVANQYDDFTDGLRELTDGSNLPENDGECIISDELLENSGLSIGDTIAVTSALETMGDSPEDITYTDISFEMKIVGTYLDATDEYSDAMMENAYTNRRNEILTTFDTLADKLVEGTNGIQISASYYLKDPEYLDAFTEEVREKGLAETFDVATDEASYEQVIKPVEALKTISIAFCIVVLIFGAIIIALLSSIAIRERKYEIGVLRAMGMKKGTVVLGLWTEMLLLTALCLALGLGLGTLIAQPVTNIMLEQQIAAAESSSAANNGFPGGDMPMNVGGGPQGLSIGGTRRTADVEPLESLDISLGVTTVLQIIAIAIVLSLLSALIATRKIVKYEPIKILMERN